MPKKRQDARSATPAPKATPESTSPVEGPPALKQGPQTSAPVYPWQPWNPPTADELRQAFDNLVGGGQKNQNPLKLSVEAAFAFPVNPDTGKTRGTFARFLGAEEWQMIAWAAYAWLQVWEPMSDDDGLDYDTATPFKAERRATRMWNR
jgi:hypothetical protein